MKFIIYAVWIFFPLAFYLMTLWGKLEQYSHKRNDPSIGDYFRTAIFLTVLVCIAFILDWYVLPGLVERYSPEAIPYLFYQIMLLPALFLIASMFGGSKDIHIKRKMRKRDQE